MRGGERGGERGREEDGGAGELSSCGTNYMLGILAKILPEIHKEGDHYENKKITKVGINIKDS